MAICQHCNQEIGRVAHLERIMLHLVAIIRETEINSRLDFTQAAHVCDAEVALQNAASHAPPTSGS